MGGTSRPRDTPAAGEPEDRGNPVTGAMSRRKGAAWEVRCGNSLRDEFGWSVRRVLAGDGLQPSDLMLPGHAEFHPVALGAGFPVAVECKNAKTLCLPAWVDQATAAAGPDRIGVVWHKRIGRPDPMAGFVTLAARDFWGAFPTGVFEGVTTNGART